MDYIETLKRLQAIQLDNIGIIDCHIETRKDMKKTQIFFSMCNYGFDDNNKIDRQNRSKLYVHKFEWKEDNIDKELASIDDEINLLKKKY